MKTVLYSLYAFSVIHCVIGQGLNDIDLPVARHPVSGHPVIPGSSIKGVLKCLSDQTSEEMKALFGADGKDNQNTFASAISINDAQLLALPIRSYYGTFAYIASSYTLENLKRQIQRSDYARKDAFSSLKIPALRAVEKNALIYKASVTSSSILYKPEASKKILLEELDLAIEESSMGDTNRWADCIADLFYTEDEDKELFKKRFAVVDDNVLNFFCETALPVSPHIAIDQKTGIVKPGALWYEEYIPSLSLFTGTIGIDRGYTKETDNFTDEQLYQALIHNGNPVNIQLGGKSTTGKGLVSILYADLA